MRTQILKKQQIIKNVIGYPINLGIIALQPQFKKFSCRVNASKRLTEEFEIISIISTLLHHFFLIVQYKKYVS
jgi:hypothetical protein